MILNKIKSIFLIVALLWTYQVNAALDFSWDYSSYNKEVKKLEKLQNSLIVYLQKDFDESLKSVSWSLDRAYFKQEFNYIKNNISDYYPYSKESTISEFKADIQYYKNLKTSILQSIAWNSPYKISSNENALVESDIVSMQKDFVKILRDYTDKYIKSDYMEEWDFDYNFSSKDFWNISIKSSKYKSIYSFLTNSQEFDLVLDSKFDIKSKEIENLSLKWNISLDLNFKIIDNIFYVSIKSYNLAFDSSNISSNEFKTIIKEKEELFKNALKKYKGKNLKIISTWTSTELSSKEISKFVSEKLDKIYDLLENESIFSTYKKLWNKYLLKLNSKTFYDLWMIIEPENSQKFDDFRNEMKSSNLEFVISKPLYFEKISNSIKLTNDLISWFWIWNQILEKKWNDYIYTSKFTSTSEYSKFSYNLYLSEKKLNLDVLSDYFTSKISWENNYLNSTFSSFWQEIIIKWALSETKTNLIWTLNNKQIMTCNINKLWENYYDYSLNLDLTELTKLKMDIKWKSKISFWKYKIETPKDYEEIKLEDLGLD